MDALRRTDGRWATHIVNWTPHVVLCEGLAVVPQLGWEDFLDSLAKSRGFKTWQDARGKRDRRAWESWKSVFLGDDGNGEEMELR